MVTRIFKAVLSAALVIAVPVVPVVNPASACAHAGERPAASMAMDLPSHGERLLVRFAPSLRGSASAASLSRSGAGIEACAPTGWSIVEPAPGQSSAELRVQLESDPAVLSVEPEYLVYPTLSVNDPLYVQQWALDDPIGGHDIDAVGGWDLLAGSVFAEEIVVAVVDSGVDLAHADLASRLWLNDDVAGNGIDDDGNGYVDDTTGWDFESGDADPGDSLGHGTHVAGVVAAQANNATGTAGVAGLEANVRIMPVRIFGMTGGASSAQAAQGILYAVDNGADIINVSWGGTDANTVLAEAVSYAEAQGVLVCAAAGNTSTSNDTTPFYPASFPNDNIIAVAATDRDGALATFSNRGATSVDIAAPGVDILSCYPGSTWARLSGTSQATPHVSGALALAWLRFAGEGPLSIRGRIIARSAAEPALAGLVASGAILDLRGVLTTIAPAGAMTLAEGATRVSTTTVTVESDVYAASTMDVDIDGDGLPDVSGELLRTRTVAVPSGDGTKTVTVTYRGEIDPPLEFTSSVYLDTVAPAPPAGLSGQPLGHGAHVSWIAPPDEDVAGYTVWGASAGIEGPYEQVQTTSAEETQTDILGLENDRTYWFRVSAIDEAGNAGATSEPVAVTPHLEVDRVAGTDRYETACALSREAFDSARTVVIATGQAFPDAVVASSLAGALDAPVLFVRRDRVPACTVAEIARLGADRIVVVGGASAVSDVAYGQLGTLVDTVERVSGSTRYATSAAVAREVARIEGAAFLGEALVARGDAFPDSVSVSAVAYSRAMPVLLVRPGALPDSIAQASEDLDIHRVYVAGGTSAVSDGVLTQLGLPFTRAQGRDRYETSTAFGRLALDRQWSAIGYLGVASGVDYADALSGGAAFGSRGGLVILTRPEPPVPGSVTAFVSDAAEGATAITVIGGSRAVSETTLESLDVIVR